MAQIKKQNKTPEKELKQADITSLSDAEFKTLVIRMHKEPPDYSNHIKNCLLYTSDAADETSTV